MKNSISVILPTYNESMNIKEMIIRLNNSVKNLKEIIVIDDDSPDGTAQVAKNMKKTKVVVRKGVRGVGSAIYKGIKIAKGNIIAWMDADLSMHPEVLPKMIYVLKNYDVVVGSRYVKNGEDRRGFVRVITSKVINLTARIVLNFKIKDSDSGFVAARREVFDNIQFDSRGHGEYCIEFLYRCVKNGYNVKEFGYVFEDRKKGISKSKENFFIFIKYGIQYFFRIIKLRFE